jgi:hypothetical protein
MAATSIRSIFGEWSGNVRSRALALDHDPLEDLDPLPVALDDAEVHTHRVARLEAREVAQLTPLEFLDDRAHGEGPPAGRRMVAEDAAGGCAGPRARAPTHRPPAHPKGVKEG